MKKIIHIDMDAFFAQVEQRDNPSLKGKPVIIGGDPRSRGVVATCSYEARVFGIHSAMPTSTAYRLCPHAQFLKPNRAAYVEVSHQIREIFRSYSNLVEPLSLDEAYIDVTNPLRGPNSATLIAEEIRAEVYNKTSLTCSAGVSYNKFLAKVASDIDKPNGITVITPDIAQEFIYNLPIKKFFGVGKVTLKKMEKLGIFKGGDLLKFSQAELVKEFGKAGALFYNYARGVDYREVTPNRERKSIGKESTFQNDLESSEEMLKIIGEVSDSVSKIAKDSNREGVTITIKIKFSDFKSITRSTTISTPTNSSEEIKSLAQELFRKCKIDKSVRLLGVSLSNLDRNSVKNGVVQLSIPFE
jgi:DNA polymerase-4